MISREQRQQLQAQWEQDDSQWPRLADKIVLHIDRIHTMGIISSTRPRIQNVIMPQLLNALPEGTIPNYMMCTLTIPLTEQDSAKIYCFPVTSDIGADRLRGFGIDAIYFDDAWKVNGITKQRIIASIGPDAWVI